MLINNSYVTFKNMGHTLEQWMMDFRRNLTDIKHSLEKGSGSVLLNNFPIHEYDASTRDDTFIDVANHFGNPKKRGDKGSVIWKVCPPQQTLNRPLSYSEQSNIAPMHTDNSYSPNPDQYLIFLAVQPANDGGENIVLSNQALLDEFRKLPDANETIKVLTQELFPFSMSHAFYTKEMGAERPIVVAPVFSDDVEVRFQIKAITEGFKRRPELASDAKRKAVEHFNGFLQAHLTLPGERLAKGDILIVNNQRAFHSRLAFSDPKRLLLRISIEAEVSSKKASNLTESNHKAA